jgi:hypothetical protein
MVNPFKGTAGTYSFYPLFAPGLLTGAPDNNHVPGTGYHPGNVLLSQLFTGSTLYAGTTPLAGTFADGTTTFGGMRFRPSEYKGLTTTKALDGGHAKRTTDYSLYSNYIFDGVTSAEAFANLGHAERTTAYSLYNNYIFDGVTSAEVMPAGYGQANTASEYGRNKVGEYKGVPSAIAL